MTSTTLPRIGDVRAYLAGTGATGALIAGAVIAFLTVGALVAFDDALLGGDDATGSAALADLPGGTAPETAAAALAATPGGVAGRPAGGVVLAAAVPGGEGAAGSPPGSDTAGSAGPAGPGTGGPTPTDNGPLSGAVQSVDDTTGPIGVPPVSPATGPITDQVDDSVRDTLNQVGGNTGNPHLGDDVSDGLNGLLP